jgi:hypothetical protein
LGESWLIFGNEKRRKLENFGRKLHSLNYKFEI